MSPVIVSCRNPKCDATYNVSAEIVGRNVKCKRCGTTFKVEATSSTDSEAEDEPVDIPSPFGKYTVKKKLGEGGMGAVYLAYDVTLKRPVALKVPLPQDNKARNKEILDRFEREAQAAASLRHPNFCPVYDYGTVGDRPYLAMAFIDGTTMASRVDPITPMDPLDAARLVRKVALAMSAAHDLKMIHRDLKPSNVMIDEAGEPIIMDFGLVRRDDSDDKGLSLTNVPYGTMEYMSPEQAKGEKGMIGPATDIYSLGVILFELVVGRRPYEGGFYSIFAAVTSDSPSPAPSSIQPGIAPAIEAVCVKAMSKPIGDRYGSMREFALALGNVLEPPKPKPEMPDNFPPIVMPEPISLLREPKVRRNLPSFDRRLIFATMMGIAAVILGVIIYIVTDNGTLKIEGFDPSMIVRVDGQRVTIEKIGDSITVHTGPHGLTIRRGDVLVEAPENFEIKRGTETAVRITRVPETPDEARRKRELAQRIANAEAEKKKQREAAEAKTKSVAEVAKKAMVDARPPDPSPPNPRHAATVASFAGSKAGDEKTLRVGNIDLVFCWCPPGEFKMGSPTTEADRDKKDEAQVDVTLTQGLWMMKTEMTQELFKTLECKKEKESDFKGPKLPVEMVSYPEAIACAEALTIKLHEANLLPSGWEIRLPTEAQWEYAARAGTKTATPFGDKLDSTMANFDGNYPYGDAAKETYLKKTMPVGSYRPNDWGLFDTAGNAWEWTLDAYHAKLPGGVDPFVAGSGASDRVSRGGSWSDGGRYCRSADRGGISPGLRYINVGFRLAAVQLVH